MVASVDGKANVGGKAGSIGSPTDRTLMRSLRARSDAVMIGAGTLRAEKLTLSIPDDLARTREDRGLKPQPLAVVATATGEVPLGTNLLSSSPDNLLILVPPETPDERLVALSAFGSIESVPEEKSGPGIDLEKALEMLKERYAIGSLLVEGGPALNHALVRAGLADELFLTISPRLLGGERPDVLTILEGPEILPNKTEPKLASVHVSGNELFLRYSLRGREEAPANPPEPRMP